MKKIKYINVQLSRQVLSNFALTLIILQIVLIITLGIFVRMSTSNTDVLDFQRYFAFENVNAMILIGFGYLMTVIKTNNFSALVYTLFVNALSMQLYLLFQGFWSQVFSAFTNDFYINVDQKLLIRGSYCVVSGLISLACVIGRINPTEIIKMSIIHVTTYSLNEYLVYYVLEAYDAGGSTTVHIFGAYFGVTMSIVLAKYARPCARPEKTYYSNVLAMFGTLFLWIYWPAFNFGVYATNTFERTQIVANTLFSLAGSTIATFVVTSMHGKGILIEDIQHASLVGGVAIGASAGILYLPAVAVTIGFLAGIVSTIAFHHLNKKLEKSLKLFDFHGIHSTHGLPGIFGGFVSAVIIAIYNTGYDENVAKFYFKDKNNNTLLSPTTNFMGKAGLQLAAVGVSLLMAILSGFAAGKFIGLFYEQKQQDFFEDSTYFDHALFLNNDDKNIRYQQLQQIKKVPMNSEREDLRKAQVYEKEEIKKLPVSSHRVEGAQKSFRERDRQRDMTKEGPLDTEMKVSARKSKRESKPK